MSRFHDLDAQINGAIEAGGNQPPEITPSPAPAPEPGDPDPETEPEKDPEEMPDETPVEKTEAFAAGVRAERDRTAAVLASEHFPGREAHVAKLLGKDMSAEDAIDLLADMPMTKPVSQEESNAAAEEAARKEMAEAMANAGTADLGADENKDGKTGRGAADDVWNRARAHIDNRTSKKGL